MMLDGRIDSQIVLSESWRSLADQNVGVFNSPDYQYKYQDPGDYRNYTSNVHFTFRDLTSDNEFIIFPQFDADQLSGDNFTEADDLPDTANANDIWVDTFDDQDYMWACKTGYTAVAMTRTITAENRPTGTTADLVFSSIATGTQYINIAFLDAGPTGVSTLTITGSGTRLSPYLYTFDLYDDDNSNNNVISLLSADLILAAAGADVTTGATYLEFTSTPLTNPNLANWKPLNILVAYTALTPELSLLTDYLHPSLHPLFKSTDVIPYLAAYNLMLMIDGADLNRALAYRIKANDIIKRIKKHKRAGVPQKNLRPR
jgi:hypothetical protein